MQNARLSKRMKTKYLRKNSLCFCPLCMKQETEQFGEPYWHRLHQIPGVTCCPKHRVKLIQAITLKDIRWKFIPAYCFISGKQMDDIKAEDDKWNIQIAEDVEWLLDHGFEPSIRKGYWDIIVNLENPKYYRNNYWTGLDKYLDIERKGDTFLDPEQENNYLPMKRPNYLSMLLFLEALGIDIRTL